MTMLTSKKTVNFTRPFVLGGFDEMLPAGADSVGTNAELPEGVSFPAHRRILTLIQRHAKPGHRCLTRTLTIDPNELDAALERDQAPDKISVGRDTDQETPIGTTESRLREADRRAAEPAEDDWMIGRRGLTTAARRGQKISS